VTKPFSLTFKQKMVARLIGKDAVSAQQLVIALTAAVVLGILVEFSPFFMRDRDQKLWPRRRG
jgi:hypothetical protein